MIIDIDNMVDLMCSTVRASGSTKETGRKESNEEGDDEWGRAVQVMWSRSNEGTQWVNPLINNILNDFPQMYLEQQTTVAVDAANRWTGVCACVFVTNITDNYHFITCLFVCSQKMCLLWSLGASNDSAVKRVIWTNSLAFLKTLITSMSHDVTFEYTHTHAHTCDMVTHTHHT